MAFDKTDNEIRIKENTNESITISRSLLNRGLILITIVKTTIAIKIEKNSLFSIHGIAIIAL